MNLPAFVDINCDMGEDESPEGIARDLELVRYVSSINVACGGHSGSPESMTLLVQAAKLHGVFIGAHPGYEDRENFGRSPVSLSAEQIRELVSQQVHRMQEICSDHDVPLHHVKPHGALYNLAEQDRYVADAIVEAVKKCDQKLTIYALADGVLLSASRAQRVPAWAEAFPDRGYALSGKLLPRDRPGAVLDQWDKIVAVAVEMALSQRIITETMSMKSSGIQTVCFHSDNPASVRALVEFSRAIREIGVPLANEVN